MKTSIIILAGSLLTAGAASVISGTWNQTNFQTQHSHSGKGPQPTLTTRATDEGLGISIVKKATTEEAPKCVFMTTFEGKGLNKGNTVNLPARVVNSMDVGMDWLIDAQNGDGGWGAGSHNRQEIRDPHAVKSDPATTAMVAMAIRRNGSTLNKGNHAGELREATMYLLNAVESSNENDLNITNLKGTQPQTKLGQNIDVVLTSQFLGNLLQDVDCDQQLRRRIKTAMAKCVDKISRGQSSNGSQQGSGWAGVLQSSFATSALETAKDAGVAVDDIVLDRSRDFQKNNMNIETNEVVTESAAGVMLYSVSGSTRASAKETAEAKNIVAKAKREGKISSSEVNVDNLRKAGVSEELAMKYNTAYQVNKAAKNIAQKDDVLSGFGNNGGEEFMSYLQTGEGLIMSHDNDWKTWYDKTSARLVGIQNNDGSWSGHHCITSPVFCTATCLLILSVNNDIERLRQNNQQE
ncbi:MAG: hypothetical protein ACU4F9_08145 [Arcticibacter sp.]